MIRKGFIVTENRINKARKIEAVIKKFLSLDVLEGKKILDIGCGNGEIINYFSDRNQVFGCDINDQLSEKVRGDVGFNLLDSTFLPYPDRYFDIVITNHVIEHVDDQLNHMKEIARVLKTDGICFFSTPNRFFPIEPHYKIPLIHYLPYKLFIFLLKKMKRYHEDLRLLSYFDMKRVFRKAGFQAHEYTAYVLRYPELYFWEGPSLKRLPLAAVKMFQALSQTNIFVLVPIRSEEQ